MVKRKEDTAQQKQREDKRYEKEIKARAERHKLFLKQVTGFVLFPTFTPISITNSPISINKNNDTTTEEEVNDPSVDNIRNDAVDPHADNIRINDDDTDDEFTTSITTEDEEVKFPPANTIRIDNDAPTTTIKEAEE